jgi:hypothetical protein
MARLASSQAGGGLAPVRVTSTRLIAFGALVAAVLIAAVAAANYAAGRPGTDLGCA